MDQKETKSVIASTESGVLSPFALKSYRVAPSLSSLCCRFPSCLFIICCHRIAHLVGNVVSLWLDLAGSHVSPCHLVVMSCCIAPHRIASSVALSRPFLSQSMELTPSPKSTAMHAACRMFSNHTPPQVHTSAVHDPDTKILNLQSHRVWQMAQLQVSQCGVEP